MEKVKYVGKSFQVLDGVTILAPNMVVRFIGFNKNETEAFVITPQGIKTSVNASDVVVY